MTTSGRRTGWRARTALVALLGCLLAVLPAGAALAAPSIKVTAPSGTTLRAGQTTRVSWVAKEVSGAVKVELTSDATTVVGTIASSVPASAGKFDWSIPVDVSTASNLRVRVTSVATPALYAESASTITFSPASLVLTYPDTGDDVDMGTRVPISWDSEGGGTVKLEYCLVSSCSYQTIRAAVPNASGQFLWDVPLSLASGSAYRVRVSSNANPAINDAGGSFDALAPDISVNAVTGATVGGKVEVKWSTPITGNVKLDLYSGASDVGDIRATVPAKTGKYTWSIPLTQASGSNFKVRVTAIGSSGSIFGESAVFTINLPALNLTAPDSGSFEGGDKTDITWTPGGLTGNVKLELFNGTTYSLIRASVPAASGKFSWTVPITVSSTAPYKVRISSVGNALITDSSSGTLTLSPPDITAGPLSGTPWTVGQTKPVTWSFGGGGNVKIELLDNGVLKTIIRGSQPAASGTYNWAIPLSLSSGTQYSIRVTSLLNPALSDTTSVFTIGLPSLGTPAVSAPPATAGVTETITWTAVSGNVKLELYNGSTYTIIKSSTPGNTGSYSWAVPLNQATGTTFQIRVTSTSNVGIVATSNTFTIDAPTLSVTAPTGGASLSKAGGPHTVTWASSPALSGNVKIELVNGSNVVVGTLKSTIAAGTLSTTFTIPAGASLGSGYKVRVTSLGRPTLSAESGSFSIVA